MPNTYLTNPYIGPFFLTTNELHTHRKKYVKQCLLMASPGAIEFHVHD